jgi:hypothetical protein
MVTAKNFFLLQNFNNRSVAMEQECEEKRKRTDMNSPYNDMDWVK